MATKISARSAAGTRDFLPEEMALRRSVRRVIEDTFELYGFQPLETPAMERLDVLTGKYGDDADRLIFKILKRGDELKAGLESGELSDLALRYDLTVPLARVIANNRDKLVFPFKRYQIQPVWRAERSQKGRYREFIQCDADVVGTTSVSADTEIIALTDDILTRLKIPSYQIQINHRLLLQALVDSSEIPPERFLDACIAIDKLDKIGWDGIREELIQRSFPLSSIRKLMDLLAITGEPMYIIRELQTRMKMSPEAEKALNDLQAMFTSLRAMAVPENHLRLSLSLARGLDYYTGPIFETIIEVPRLGSITGGGRYDRLIGIFSGEAIPATGTTIGIERIFDVIKALNISIDDQEPISSVMVVVFSEEVRPEATSITAELRRVGIRTEIYLDEAKKLGKQFSYSDRRGIHFVIIAGPDEISRGEVIVKNLKTGDQLVIKRDQLVRYLLNL
jgi:histidyl-tRNA synthetase